MATIIKRSETAYLARIRMYDHNVGVGALRLRNKTFRTHAEAAAWVKEVEATIIEGSYDDAPTTLEYVVHYYLELRKLEMDAHQYAMRNQQVQWWLKFIGKNVNIQRISRQRLMQGVDLLTTMSNGRGGHKSVPTVNRYVAAIGNVLAKAVDMGWLEKNPCHKLKKAENNTHVRFLNSGEKTRLLAMCERSQAHQLYPLVRLAISTGGRKSELTGLTWADIDFKNKSIRFVDTKNALSRSVAINNKMVQILTVYKSLTAPDSDYEYVFKSSHSSTQSAEFNPRVSFEYAVTNAKVPNFTFHDLRHTFASYMAQNGASLLELMELLGHKKLNMVLRYAHLIPAQTDKVVRNMLDTVDL